MGFVGRSLVRLAGPLLVAALPLSTGCARAAPAPYGEVLVVADTDGPVGDLLQTVRIDLYREDGTWFDSRTQGAGNPYFNWPVSFGVYGTDPTHDTRVIVRLRAYTQNGERDYLGERYAPRPTYTEPPVALSLADVCSQAQPLVLGQPLTLRRGPFVVNALKPQGDCGAKAVSSGSVAATLTVTQSATYHIEVTSSLPIGVDTALLVRRSCLDPTTQIACNDDISSSDLLSYLPDLQLDPGIYSVQVLGIDGGPADLVLRATLADQWSASSSAAGASSLKAEPRLIVNGVDTTPATEPQPLLTIDRLALIHVTPGVQQTAQVILRGNCAGTMARLSATAPYQQLDVNGAATCLDTEATLVPLADEPLIPGFADVHSLPDHRLEFVDGLGCPDASHAPRSGTICVAGGVMAFGEEALSGRGVQDAVPRRLAKMTPFWMDANEVTVADWRAAVAAGLYTSIGPQANEGDLATNQDGSFSTLCTWSTTPRGREDYALTCIEYGDARSFCQARGGDLPTEAQWEFAASGASWYENSGNTASGQFGARYEYPWTGNPTRSDWCDIAVYGRVVNGSCYGADAGDASIQGSVPCR